MRRSAFHLLLLLVITLATLTVPGVQPLFAQQSPEVPATSEQPLAPDFVPGQLIIRFQPTLTPDEIQAFYQEYGLTEMDDLDPAPSDEERPLKLAFVPVDVNQTLIDTLERDPRVVYAEPNYILQVNQGTPNDPDFAKLWGLQNSGQTGGTAGADISAVDGWKVTTGSKNVVVAIIDTGVDYTHEDLAANMWVNAKECPGGIGKCVADGVDDDDNGYADDFHGINAVAGTGDPMDDYGHGTHVAGTIGAKGNNNIGVVGVNHNVTIVACKFLSATGGGSVADAVKCFNYVDHLKNDQGINIIATNNSWGGTGAAQALQEAMSGADQPLHICAAGNGNSDAPHYPAAFELDNIIAVAATDDNDLYADFSNFGPWVDLAAPGDAIYSTIPTGSCAICDPSGYGTIGGTSMATPHVAGAVALIAAKYPQLSLAQIRQRILTGVDPLNDPAKNSATNGRLNIFNTLEEDTTAPASVSDLVVTGLLLTQMELTWTATGDDGMTGMANAYDLRYSTAPITEENWENATPAVGEPKPQKPGSKETFLVPGLEPDTTYYFALKVLDNVGNASPLSNVVIGKTSAGAVAYSDDMESGAGEWTTLGTDDFWHLSEHRANSPTHAWYYGNEDTRTYETGGATSGSLTSPVIELATNDDVLLTFYEWSELEGSDAFDRTRVQLSTDEGSTWVTVFESHNTDDEWVKRSVSLTPFVGDANTIQVRYWFDSVDNRFNTFEGWYVDDVAVLVAEKGVPGAGPSQANLFIQADNIGLSDPDPAQGDEVTVSAVVINNGGEEANDVMVQFVDVSDTTPKPLGTPQTISNISVGGSATAQVKIDSSDHAGLYTVQVTVDPYNLISEGNEGDNVAQRTFTVTAPAAPNLVIDMSNIAFNPAAPQPGDQVTIHAVIRNDGAMAAQDVTVQVLDVTDTAAVVPIGISQTIDLLPPGGVATAQVTYDTSGMSGDRKIKVVIDPANTVSEGNEEDNETQATLSLAESTLPNLALTATNVGFDPENPAPGQTVTINATVFNDGDRPAEKVLVRFIDVTSGEFPIGDPLTIESIPAGGSGMVQVDYETEGLYGDRKIEISVDPYNFIVEERESDNEVRATLSIQTPSSANLTVATGNIGIFPAQPTQGVTATVTAVIRNSGDAPVGSFTVQFLDVSDGALIPIGEGQNVEGIEAGGSALAQVTYPTAGLTGIRRIQVVADPNNFVPEANEDDNQATQSLTILPAARANLAMSAGNIAFSPPKPTEGDVVTITAVVLNNGAVATQRVIVQFVDVTNGNFEPIGLEQFIDVPQGGSAIAKASYATLGKAGSRKIQVLIDSNNLVAEQDENDNEATATLIVEPSAMANLVITPASIGFEPNAPTVNQPVTVTVTVQNQGEAAANNVVVQLLDLSDGEATPVGAPVIVPRIAAGGAMVVQMGYVVPDEDGEKPDLTPSERTLRVAVDPSNFVLESDETDNRATAILSVTPADAPNLVVSAGNIGFLPNEPTDGEVVTLTVTILNVGNAPANAVLVQFVDVTDGGAEPIGAKQTIEQIAPGESASTFVLYETTGKVGERRIRVVADPHQIIPERSESDNEAVTLLRVANAPLPNVLVTMDNIGFSHSVAHPGDAVSVTVTILNNGSGPAENVVVQFVDPTSGAPLAANQVITTILPGGAGTVQFVYDTRGRFGERDVQVVVDPNNLIVEQNENDNRAAASFRVAIPPVPNLVIRATQIGFDPGEIGIEGAATIYATVINDGGAAVGEVIVHFLDVTDGGSTPIGDPQTISDIGPGASGLVQVSYAVPIGSSDRKIQVVVDPNNTIYESSESDNQATATLARSKSALANLMITAANITYAPTTPSTGDVVTIRAVVLNNGASDAEDVIVQFTDVTGASSSMATGTPVGPQQSVPLIPSGGSAVVEMSYAATEKAGSRTVRVAIDPNNFIAEGRETDNMASLTFEIVAPDQPNLVVLASNVNFNPLTISANGTVTVRAVVLNHGAREARDVVVQFMDVSGGSQVPIGSPQTLARIAPGNAATAQMSFAPSSPGDFTVQVVADPNNFIVESNELDNRASKSLTVGAPPAPNLVALSSNMEFVPSAPQDGNLVTIHATALNNGTMVATDVVVRVEDVTDAGAPQLIGKQRLIDSLQPGEEATVQVMYDTTDKAGDRTIRMVVDPLNSIAESDEADNEAITVLTISPPPAPNLVLGENSVRFSPASPSDGQVVTVTVTVLNEGQRNASRVEVQVMDVSNGTPTPVGDIQIIGGISSGGSGVVQVTYDTTGKQGDRKLQVVVDPANLIAETNEEDNQTEATLTVKEPSDDPSMLPNLVMTSSSVIVTPTLALPGDIVTMTISVYNGGAVAASGVAVRVMDVTGTPVQVGDDIIIPSIAAGGTQSVTMPYNTGDQPGSKTLTVSADPDNSITESNENDNTSTVTIPIAASSGTALSGQSSNGTIPVAEPAQMVAPTEGDRSATVNTPEVPPSSELGVEMAEDLNLRD